MNITKKYISSLISNELSISSEDSILLFDSFINAIKKETLNKKVKIQKFGTFAYRSTKARVGRNPKTMDEFNILARKKLFFSASAKIKSLIN